MNFNLTGYELALIAGGFGVIGVLLGAWASHRFSDHRDRRKEFNEAADALAKILMQERACPTPYKHIDFFDFRRVIVGGELRRFNKAVELYEKANKDQEDNILHYSAVIGRSIKTFSYYHDSTSIQSAIDTLLEFTKRK